MSVYDELTAIGWCNDLDDVASCRDIGSLMFPDVSRLVGKCRLTQQKSTGHEKRAANAHLIVSRLPLKSETLARKATQRLIKREG